MCSRTPTRTRRSPLHLLNAARRPREFAMGGSGAKAIVPRGQKNRPIRGMGRLISPNCFGRTLRDLALRRFGGRGRRTAVSPLFSLLRHVLLVPLRGLGRRPAVSRGGGGAPGGSRRVGLSECGKRR